LNTGLCYFRNNKKHGCVLKEMISVNRPLIVWILVSFLCDVSLVTTAVQAQDTAIPKYKVRVNIVSLDVEVLDKDGIPVQHLSQDDFLVKENGRKVNIVNFSHLYNNPVSLAILLDTSTIESKKLIAAKQFILDIIHLMDHKDDICLYSFDTRDAYLESDFTLDRASAVDALENIAVPSKRKMGFLAELFGADPATGLGIDRAIRSQANSKHNKKALLVISNRFRGLGPATVEHLQSSRCTLYTLEFDNKSATLASMGGDQLSKKQLIRESGGRKFSAETGNIMDMSRAIVASMKNYYSIGYETEDDTKERRINVSLPGYSYKVNTRRIIK
jgi:VWFA-related protein